jgi:predicted RNA-binding Zn-ribbon protein involved in translation (DUF1610 family)
MSDLPAEMIPDESKFLGTLPDCPECGEPVNRGKFIDGDLYHWGGKDCYLEAMDKYKRYVPMPCPDCGHPNKEEKNRYYSPWYDTQDHNYICGRCGNGGFTAPWVYEKFGYTRLPRGHPNTVSCESCDGEATMYNGTEYLCLKCRTKQVVEVSANTESN